MICVFEQVEATASCNSKHLEVESFHTDIKNDNSPYDVYINLCQSDASDSDENLQSGILADLQACNSFTERYHFSESVCLFIYLL